MSVSRWWTEAVAAVGDVLPLPLVALLIVLVAGLIAAGWYWFPAWIPRRVPRWIRGLRLRRLRWRRRPRRTTTPEQSEQDSADDLPDLTPAAFTSLADRLAAEGDYAAAVRERLRAMVRELVDRRVVEHRPGWTVTELAAAAGLARPEVSDPIARAADIFSQLWYAQLPAGPQHDAQMRALADELHRTLSAGPANPDPARPAAISEKAA